MVSTLSTRSVLEGISQAVGDAFPTFWEKRSQECARWSNQQGQCHTRKRFIDFRSFFETVIVAEAQRRGVQTVALVLDNGPTHASKQLPGWVSELATRSDGKLTMQLYWLPTNASWLDQIEIWFSLLQRKLLQPNHFTSRDELQQTIQDFIRHYNQTAKPLTWSYTVEKLERKLGTN